MVMAILSSANFNPELLVYLWNDSIRWKKWKCQGKTDFALRLSWNSFIWNGFL